jgi:hypothetical protein
MTLVMDVKAAVWLTTKKLTEVSCRARGETHQRRSHLGGDKWARATWILSTVLAQDHFFSDFLSLHLTNKNHKEPMMMPLDVTSMTSSSAPSCRFDDSLEVADD